MNPVLDVIEKRRSVRAFSDQPITEAETQAILHAAFRAPTAGNMMLYTIIQVTDQAIKDRLAVTCDNQPFIAKAPLVLVFLADYQRWYDGYMGLGLEERAEAEGLATRKPAEGDLLLACCDALIAAQTAVIAAESLGIGSCYIGDILENYEIHREMFNLPRYALPVAMLVFGRPVKESAPAFPTPRFSPEFILHTNTYQRMAVGELDAMFEPARQRQEAMGNTFPGAQKVVSNYYTRKFISDFSVEMSRSVREMIRSWME